MNAVLEDTLWQIKADAINPNRYFGITVANGMIGMVSAAAPMQINEVILNGVYDKYQRGRVSNILKGFNPFNLDLEIGGRRASIESVSNLSQEINLKEAIFTTRFSMKPLEVKHQILALRNLPFSALVVLELQAKEDCEFTVFNEINAPDHLREVEQRYSEIDRPHVKIPLMTSVANSPTGKIQLAASNSYIFEEAHGAEPQLIHEDWDFNRHLVKFSKKLKKGQSYRFAMVSSLCTSAHFTDPANEAERLSIFAKLEGVDRLKRHHIQEWDKLWQGDIAIQGNPVVQREVRLMLYYLYSSARAGTALSISPVGLSGLGYNGHVFWDTELWMYPTLLALQPDIAKSLLDYRFERLDTARQNAFSHGYKGAMFPWESAEDGTEQTPVWALTGPFQQHISACIAWAFWKYYQVTQDKEWLKEKGMLILKEVAEFWCSRIERNGSGQYEITNVIGANEFEENIDNNAFTNGIVKTVLQYATQAAELLGLQANPDWNHVAENIPILQFEDGTTRENATYDGAIIKQADVNLLAHPLDVIQEPAQIRRDLEYYEPRLSPDGPAMGIATMATLRAKLGDLEHAYHLFLQSYQPNGLPPFQVLSECAGGKGIQPYFTTGAGGALQALIFGFGGISITDEGICRGTVQLPNAFEGLKIKINSKSKGQ